MTPETFRRVEELFHAAQEREPHDRADFLAEACGSQSELRREVEALLAVADSRTTERWAVLPSLPPPVDGGALAAGEELDAYRIIRKIDFGGMGEVYEAEEAPPTRRKVAIKVVRRDLVSQRDLARFDSERQALSTMNHPHIAQIFASATTPQGRPYFVMEYVSGQSITRFCDERQSTVGERLALFVQVCHGVQHAHQKGVLHRDLKPSNVLVTVLDGEPVAKVIDFGVCLALEGAGQLLGTSRAERVGTLDYMAPEQRANADLDTRTDVYALGLLLYELLVGRLPPAAPAGEPPLRASDDLARAPARATKIASRRGSDVQALTRALRGDVDWILAKALQPDRERRYASAAELANDVERHFAHQPVTAAPASRSYRLAKAVRRHRVGFAAAVVAVLALVVGAAGLATGLVQARRAQATAVEEAARANQEAQTSRRISDFLVDLFAASEPERAQGSKPTARELLDRGGEDLLAGLESEPVVRAALMTAVGKAYLRLGEFDQAEPLLERARAILRSRDGASAVQKIQLLNVLGDLRRLQARYGEARALFDEAARLDSSAGRRAAGFADLADSLNGIGLVYFNQSEYAQAEPYFQRALRLWRAAGDKREGVALGHLALLAREQGQYPRALELFEQTQAVLERVVGPNHPDIQGNLNNWADAYRATGQLRKAEALIRRVVEINARVFGPDNPYSVVSLNNLAMVLVAQERYAEAEPLYREVLASDARTRGVRHPDYATSLHNLAVLYRRQQRYAEAEPMFRQALAIRLAALGPEHKDVGSSYYHLGWVRQARGDYTQAERLYRQALAIREKALGPNHAHVAGVLGRLGDLYRETGRPAEAEPLLRRALAIWNGAPQLDKLNLATTLETFAAVLEATGRQDEAKQHRARAQQLRQELDREKPGR